MKNISKEDFGRKNGWTVFNGNEIEVIDDLSEFYDDENLPNRRITDIDKAVRQATNLGFVVAQGVGESGNKDAYIITNYNSKGDSTYAEGGEVGEKVGKLLTSLDKALKDKELEKFNSISNEIHRISDNEGLNKKEYDKWDSIREKERKYQFDNFGSTYAEGGEIGKSE
tara:strand:+ start:186 stop:692 length:507 start_codon:yes stop_codon:yes gene_type:complete